MPPAASLQQAGAIANPTQPGVPMRAAGAEAARAIWFDEGVKGLRRRRLAAGETVVTLSPREKAEAKGVLVRSPLRALLMGTALTIGTAYWGFWVVNVGGGDSWTGASLMRGPLFVLFCLVAANLFLRSLRSRLHLDQRELIIIYTMVVMGAAINGTGMLDNLVPAVGGMQYYREAFGFDLFLKQAPQHLIIHNPQVISDFFQGGRSIWSLTIMRDWAGPVLWWSAFILAFIFAVLCLQVLVRRQWFQSERLTFPLAYVPLAITAGGGAELKGNRLFWRGFWLVAIAQAMSGLNFYFPGVPHISLRKTELTQLEHMLPWSQMGSINFAYNPYLIAIAYFVNLDVSLSIWLFYVLFKVSEYFFTIYGLGIPSLIGKGSQPLLVFMDDQGVGAFIGLVIVAAWMARRRIAEVARIAWQGWQRDEEELLSYRSAVLGVLLGSVFMTWFLAGMGLAVEMAIPVVIIMFIFCMALSRLVAESGYAYHTPESGAGETVLFALGERNVPIRDQVALGYLSGIDQFYHDNPAPQQINAMKLADASAMPPRHLLLAILVGAVVALAADWWAQLAIYYKYGAGTGHLGQTWTPRGTVGFRFMKSYYELSRSPNWLMMQAVAFGIGFVMLLMRLRSSFLWFPLHPAGYLIAGTPAARSIWLPFMLGWGIKSLAVAFGGLAVYRRWVPFFLGVIVGDTVTPAAFSAVGAITGQPTYQFFP